MSLWKKMNLEFLAASLILFLCLGCFAFGANATGYEASQISLTPGSNSLELNISWYSNNNSKSIVQIAKGNDMTGTDFPENAASTFLSDITPTMTGFYTNKSTIKNLKPLTQYVYRLGDGAGNWSPVYNYTTRKTDEFNIIAIGDAQIRSIAIGTDTEGWSNTISKAIGKFKDTSFILSAGDQVDTTDSGDSEVEYSGFFKPSELRSYSVAPCLGNHDGADCFNYHFYLPNFSTGTGDYYFTYGNALFMVLNSKITKTSLHRSFIENAIASNQDKKWRIVMFHKTIYGSGGYSDDDENNIEKNKNKNELSIIFDDNDIDMVLSGHEHVFTRTFQMFGNVPQLNQTTNTDGSIVNPSGTFYMTLNSSSGSNYWVLANVKKDFVAVREQLKVPAFSNISINDTKLNISTYRTDTMEITDTYTVIKSDTVKTPIQVNISPTVTTKPSKPVNYIYGDVNGDCEVDSGDYSILRKYLLRITDKMPGEEWEEAADLNQDGDIDSADYSILRKYLLRVIDKIPLKN